MTMWYVIEKLTTGFIRSQWERFEIWNQLLTLNIFNLELNFCTCEKKKTAIQYFVVYIC